ncbi:MAG: hypothetical protein GXO05_02400, partial [Aquificae bacterium]|nr:hypothetical protein [Aquificota bacterium]
VYLHGKDSPYYQKINDKILKNKYLAKRIHKSFEFYKFQLGTEEARNFISRYSLEEREGVYFIDPSSGTILYSLTDLSQPCRCANLINYFSRKLHKKGIDPEKYVEMAEEIGAYRQKSEDILF